MYNKINFDDKFFEGSGIIFWIYDNGLTEYTNEEIHRAKASVIYARKIKKGNNSISTIEQTGN